MTLSTGSGRSHYTTPPLFSLLERLEVEEVEAGEWDTQRQLASYHAVHSVISASLAEQFGQ